jgi:hypothetical protein
MIVPGDIWIKTVDNNPGPNEKHLGEHKKPGANNSCNYISKVLP